MQTANAIVARRRGVRDLVDILLPFDFLLADAVRFIPMEFRFPYASAAQSHNGNAFHLTPTAPAVQSAKPLAIPDACSLCDRRDVGDLADSSRPLTQSRLNYVTR